MQLLYSPKPAADWLFVGRRVRGQTPLRVVAAGFTAAWGPSSRSRTVFHLNAHLSWWQRGRCAAFKSSHLTSRLCSNSRLSCVIRVTLISSSQIDPFLFAFLCPPWIVAMTLDDCWAKRCSAHDHRLPAFGVFKVFFFMRCKVQHGTTCSKGTATAHIHNLYLCVSYLLSLTFSPWC